MHSAATHNQPAVLQWLVDHGAKSSVLARDAKVTQQHRAVTLVLQLLTCAHTHTHTHTATERAATHLCSCNSGSS